MTMNPNQAMHNISLNQFLTRVFNGNEIEQRDSDGFLNGTTMGKVGGKKMKDYNQLIRADKFKIALLKQG